MYDKLSLRYKVPLRTSALILIVGAVVSISIIIRSYQVFRQDLVTGSETLISIISRSLTPTILHDDVWISYEIINTPLAAAKDGTNLKPSAIIVLNPQGRVYVSTAPKIYPMLSDVRSSVPAFGKLSKAPAAIGRFTAGIAHEINNPLGGLLNATSTLRKHGPKDELTQNTARLLDRGLYQIKDTVGALLVEARADEHAVTPQDIEDTRTLVTAEAAGKGAELDWRNEITSEVKIPATAARQILINLLLNAIHAIPDQGRIICQIKTHNVHLEFFTQNEGPQISQERMEQLFEPFSSGTRGGRGLGLWVTYQLVQSLDGEITVSSGNQDTQFVVRLPIQEAA